MKKRPLKDKFWEKVDKNGPVPEHCPELGQCWIWIAHKNRDGYGVLGQIYAHRAAWLLEKGELSSHKVLHRCDNRACVRFAHLFEGSQRDNVEDMERKKRAFHPCGEAQGLAKLTNADVIEIRGFSTDGLSRNKLHEELAKKYGVSRHAIYCVLRRKTWRHI